MKSAGYAVLIVFLGMGAIVGAAFVWPNGAMLPLAGIVVRILVGCLDPFRFISVIAIILIVQEWKWRVFAIAIVEGALAALFYSYALTFQDDPIARVARGLFFGIPSDAVIALLTIFISDLYWSKRGGAPSA